MHNVSSDEEEPLAAGLAIGSQRIASGAAPSGAAGVDPASAESAEEESAYHFRRSKSTQYHRVGFLCFLPLGFTLLNHLFMFAAAGQPGGQLAVGGGRRLRH